MTIYWVIFGLVSAGALGFWLGGIYVLRQIPLKEAAARQALYEAKEAELKALNETLARLQGMP